MQMLDYNINDIDDINTIKKTLEEDKYLYVGSDHSDKLREYILLGKLGKLLTQYDNVTTEYSVRAEGGLSNTSSSKGLYDIPPHTDGIDLQVPPKYLGLYCVNQGSGPVCYTSFCDIDHIFNNLQSESLRQLQLEKDEKSTFKYSFHLATIGTDKKENLTIDQIQEKRENLNVNMLNSINEFMRIYHENCSTVSLKTGDCLLINNHQFIHSRSNHQSYERHLYRYWIQ